MKHLVFFSGGMGSFATTYRILNDERWKVDVNDLELLFTDTQIEDKTLYIFLMQSCQYLFKKDATDIIKKLENLTETNINLTERKEQLKEISKEAGKLFPQFHWLRYEFEGNPISPWDIFYNEKFIGNSRVANCSKILKQRMAKDYIVKTFKPNEIKVYLGIDWSESHRRNAPIENWKNHTNGVDFPLCEEPYVDREYKIELLKQCNIDLPKLYQQNFEHNNCFSGDTEFITKEGVFKLKDKVGEELLVLSNGRSQWTEATVKSFGVQELWELKMKRGMQEDVIFTTANHRWYVKDDNGKEIMKTTIELTEGSKITSLFPNSKPKVKLSKIGIMHGIVYGDGSIHTIDSNIQEPPVFIRLCGNKSNLKEYFEGNFEIRYDIDDENPNDVIVNGLPRFFKEKPNINEHNGYLAGWLAGYISTDGTVKNSNVSITSSKYEDILVVKSVCNILGIKYMNCVEYNRKGFNDHETPMYTLNFYRDENLYNLILRNDHKEKYDFAVRSIDDWTVMSIKPTGKEEEVYCAVVPETETFTLKNYQKTFNCGGFCVRAGQGHFRQLYLTNPELFNYHANEEKKLMEVIKEYKGDNDARYSILKKTRKGVVYQLPLEDLREMIHQESDEIDKTEMGGCGCFVTDDMNEEDDYIGKKWGIRDLNLIKN